MEKKEEVKKVECKHLFEVAVKKRNERFNVYLQGGKYDIGTLETEEIPYFVGVLKEVNNLTIRKL